MLNLDQKLIVKSNNTDEYDGKKVKIKTKYFTKISRGYEQIYKMIYDKFKYYRQKVNMEEIVLLNLFDSVNYLEKVEGKVDLVSFSTTLDNNNLLNNFYYSTGQSSSILIWM